MSGVSAEISGSADQCPAGNNAGSDSRTHGQVNEVVNAAACSEETFRQRGAVRIVFKTARHAEMFLKILENGYIFPEFVVGGRKQNAVGYIGGSGGGYAEAADVFHCKAVFPDQFLGVPDHLRQNIFRTGVLVFNPPVSQQFTFCGNQPGDDFCAANIKTKYNFFFRHDKYSLSDF